MSDDSPGRTDPAWVVRAQQDIDRLSATLDASRTLPELLSDPTVEAHRESATKALTEAKRLLNQHRGNWLTRRLLTSGASYAAVLAKLHVASEELVYCQSAESLLARAPGLAAAVRTYIGPGDTRREVYLTYLQNLRDSYGPKGPGTGSPRTQPRVTEPPPVPPPHPVASS